MYSFLSIPTPQVRVRVYELVEKEFKSRGKGLLKVIQFSISFALNHISDYLTPRGKRYKVPDRVSTRRRRRRNGNCPRFQLASLPVNTRERSRKWLSLDHASRDWIQIDFLLAQGCWRDKDKEVDGGLRTHHPSIVICFLLLWFLFHIEFISFPHTKSKHVQCYSWWTPAGSWYNLVGISC